MNKDKYNEKKREKITCICGSIHAKNSKSDHITIEFYNYSDNYLFQFTDNGVGMNEHENPKGFGLKNIEKRILNYKGIFEINSELNQGTIIQISIPKK